MRTEGEDGMDTGGYEDRGENMRTWLRTKDREHARTGGHDRGARGRIWGHMDGENARRMTRRRDG